MKTIINLFLINTTTRKIPDIRLAMVSTLPEKMFFRLSASVTDLSYTQFEYSDLKMDTIYTTGQEL